MKRYWQPKFHHDTLAGKRIKGANQFCHYVESPDVYDPYRQKLRNVKAYFTDQILAGIQIEYRLISNYWEKIKNVTFSELGTEVDEQNFQEVDFCPDSSIKRMRVYTSDNLIIGLEFQVWDGKNLLGSDDAQYYFEWDYPTQLHGQSKTHLNALGAMYGSNHQQPRKAERKPDIPHILETSILGKTQNEQSKFSDLSFCKTQHHITQATLEADSIGIVGITLDYVDTSNVTTRIEHKVVQLDERPVPELTETMILEPTERFINVCGRYDGVLKFLELETNKNRKLSVGIEEGDEIDFFVAPNKHLAGFVGSFDEVLSSIGLILYNDLSVNLTYQEDNR